MQRKSILFLSLILALALYIIHFTAMKFYLYWTLWWFDILTHFLGGLAIGLFVVWIISGLFPMLSSKKLLVVGVITILVFGIGWEIFENVFGFPRSPKESYPIDTTLDLAMDVLGAVAAVSLARFLKSS